MKLAEAGLKLWWADPNLPLRESREERLARRGIWIPGGVLAVILILLGRSVGSFLSMDEHVTVLIEAVTVFPGSILASRALFGALCPELMKRADENAARRIRKEELKREDKE
jgi:hypothetical protein